MGDRAEFNKGLTSRQPVCINISSFHLVVCNDLTRTI